MQINKAIKRFFDIVLSLIAIIILLPLFAIVSIAIKIDSHGPVIFKQKRRTKNGKVFNILKFRSMIVNAEKTGTGLFNYENDKRVTKVGRSLRNSSIDELPQLVNILLGDMSIVGPRPCVINELGDYDTLNLKYKKRFNVKAGLTGLAQVKGRNNISWEEKVKYDNQYIDFFEKYGILVDIKIVIDSIIKVFKKENIYEQKIENMNDEIEMAKKEEQEIIELAHKKEK